MTPVVADRSGSGLWRGRRATAQRRLDPAGMVRMVVFSGKVEWIWKRKGDGDEG